MYYYPGKLNVNTGQYQAIPIHEYFQRPKIDALKILLKTIIMQ